MKKKLMILLIAALFVAMIFSTGCKKKFDITGTWTVYGDWYTWITFSGTVTFSGDKTNGTFVDFSNGTGTYTVDGNNVRWEYPSGTFYIGTSTDDNVMSGTMNSTSGLTGTWNAVR